VTEKSGLRRTVGPQARTALYEADDATTVRNSAASAELDVYTNGAKHGL